MVYAFSSATSPLYRRDVLDACCYPEGHIIRLRYSERLVPERVHRNPTRFEGEKGLLVFADGGSPQRTNSQATPTATGGTPPTEQADFTFYPIREIEVAHLQLTAGVLLVDVRLGNFLNYGPDGDRASETQWDHQIKSLPNRPRPQHCAPKEGHFFYIADDQMIPLPVEDDPRQLAWRSVIERINRSSLCNCVTFRILGFYHAGTRRAPLAAWAKPWADRARNWTRVRRTPNRSRRKESSPTEGSPIPPTTEGPDCTYNFRMGEMILLKMLFYRSPTAPLVFHRALRLRKDEQAFSSASTDQVAVRFRYNEERIFLTCKRTTDPILSSLSLDQSANDDNEIWSPQPRFTVRVAPPHAFFLGNATLFGIGLLCLSVTGRNLSAIHLDHSGWAWMFKPLGTLLVILATWNLVRKFPLK